MGALKLRVKQKSFEGVKYMVIDDMKAGEKRTFR